MFYNGESLTKHSIPKKHNIELELEEVKKENVRLKEIMANILAEISQITEG